MRGCGERPLFSRVDFASLVVGVDFDNSPLTVKSASVIWPSYNLTTLEYCPLIKLHLIAPTKMSQTSEADTKSTVTNPRNSFIPGDATAQDKLLAEVDKLINTLSNKMAGVSSEIFAKCK